MMHDLIHNKRIINSERKHIKHKFEYTFNSKYKKSDERLIMKDILKTFETIHLMNNQVKIDFI